MGARQWASMGGVTVGDFLDAAADGTPRVTAGLNHTCVALVARAECGRGG